MGRRHVGGKVSRKGPCVKCGSYYWKLGSGQIRESDETAKVTVRPAAACRDLDPASAPVPSVSVSAQERSM